MKYRLDPKPQFRINLDKRRKKKNGKFPVKLWCYFNDGVKKDQKAYPTKVDMTERGFEKVWLQKNPQGENLRIQKELEKIKAEAIQTANQLNQFSFESFEKSFFENGGKDVEDVFWYYHRKFEDKGISIKTFKSYDNSLKSLKKYLEKRRGKIPDRLEFNEITVSFLEDYENWMVRDEGCTPSTVGVYLRPLRTVFNLALSDGITDNYPFGKKGYKIPNTKKTKKGLLYDTLKVLAKANIPNKKQEKARDFFLLTFNMQGMNLKDLALARNRDLEWINAGSEENEGYWQLTFYRSKKEKTAKTDLKEIPVPFDEKVKRILDKYRSSNSDPDARLLDIVSDNDGPYEVERKITNTNRFINQHLKPLAKRLGLPERISYGWGRHSYAARGYERGLSIYDVKESLGHSEIATTIAYLGSLETQNNLIKTNMELSKGLWNESDG